MYTCRLTVKQQFLKPTVKRRLSEICLQIAQANLENADWERVNPKIEVIVNHTDNLQFIHYPKFQQTEVSDGDTVLMVICRD